MRDFKRCSRDPAPAQQGASCGGPGSQKVRGSDTRSSFSTCPNASLAARRSAPARARPASGCLAVQPIILGSVSGAVAGKGHGGPAWRSPGPRFTCTVAVRAGGGPDRYGKRCSRSGLLCLRTCFQPVPVAPRRVSRAEEGTERPLDSVGDSACIGRVRLPGYRSSGRGREAGAGRARTEPRWDWGTKRARRGPLSDLPLQEPLSPTGRQQPRAPGKSRGLPQPLPAPGPRHSRLAHGTHLPRKGPCSVRSSLRMPPVFPRGAAKFSK